MKKKHITIILFTLLIIFGCSSTTPTPIDASNKEVEGQKAEVSKINNFLKNNRSLLESNDIQAVTELITLLSKSNSVINMEYFPLFQNLQIGTKCISIYNNIVECNPRDNNQLWVMDTNGNIINAANRNVLLSFTKDNHIINTFTIETVTTDNITKRYLKDTNSNTYVAIKNNELIIDTNIDKNSNIDNLIQLRDPIWSLMDLQENKKLLLTILNIQHKLINNEVTYTDIDNMEQRLVTNYTGKPYPLLTDKEQLIVATLNNDKKLYLLKENIQAMAKSYLQAKMHADEVEKFIADNKINIGNNNPEIIQNLLNIVSKGKFGVNVNKPIYSAMTIDNGKCMTQQLYNSITAKSCNTSNKKEKWAVDPFRRIRSYQDQNKCWELPLSNERYLEYKECSQDIKQIFKLHIFDEKTYILSGIGNYETYTIDRGPDNRIIVFRKHGNANQQIKNMSIDNKSMFWLLKPETRLLLADIIETKTSK